MDRGPVMNQAQTLQDFSAVAQRANIKAFFATADLSVVRYDIDGDDYETLWKKIDGFNAQEAWLCYQSSIHRFMKNAHFPVSDPEVEGCLLSAELVNGDTSLHIRQRGSGWSLIFLTETAAQPNSATAKL